MRPKINILLHFLHFLQLLVRVDQWILHQLRMSVLDVKLLANTFELEHGNITDEAQWQDDVLAKVCVAFGHS